MITGNKPAGLRTTLYSSAELNVVLDAMSAQLVYRLPAGTPVTVVGILRRGAPLADQLCARLNQYGQAKDIARLDLEIKRYADDLTLLHPETRLLEVPGHEKIDLSGRIVVIVDDVLYHGYSMLRALQYLVPKKPSAIRTVVLVDRGVCKLPVHADVVGLRLDVAPQDVIECHVPPYEDELKIELLQLETHPRENQSPGHA